VELLGDALVMAPVVELAQARARHGGAAATYLYVFAGPARIDEAYPRWVTGAAGDDLAMVFGAPLADGVDPFAGTGYTRADRAEAELMLRYWCNFIRTGWVLITTLIRRVLGDLTL
jgi:carboxylesterase type B